MKPRPSCGDTLPPIRHLQRTSQTSNPVGTHNGPRPIFSCPSIGLFLFLILLYSYVFFFLRQAVSRHGLLFPAHETTIEWARIVGNQIKNPQLSISAFSVITWKRLYSSLTCTLTLSRASYSRQCFINCQVLFRNAGIVEPSTFGSKSLYFYLTVTPNGGEYQRLIGHVCDLSRKRSGFL